MALSVAAMSGLTAAGVVVFFILMACLFIYCRRYMIRRNTRVTSSLDARYGNTRITNPVYGAFSTYREPRPQTLTPSECVGLIKVPPPIRTSTLRDKLSPPEYDVYYGPQSLKTHEEVARELGFTMDSQAPNPSQDDEPAPSISSKSSRRSHESSATAFSFELDQPDTPGVKEPQNQQTPLRSASSSYSASQTTPNNTVPGLPVHPKHNSTSINAKYRNFSRQHVRDLSVSRGNGVTASYTAAKVGQISGPIVTVGTRYEEEEKARQKEKAGKSYLDVLAERQKNAKRESVSSRKSLW